MFPSKNTNSYPFVASEEGAYRGGGLRNPFPNYFQDSYVMTQAINKLNPLHYDLFIERLMSLLFTPSEIWLELSTSVKLFKCMNADLHHKVNALYLMILTLKEEHRD